MSDKVMVTTGKAGYRLLLCDTHTVKAVLAEGIENKMDAVEKAIIEANIRGIGHNLSSDTVGAVLMTALEDFEAAVMKELRCPYYERVGKFHLEGCSTCCILAATQEQVMKLAALRGKPHLVGRKKR